MIKKITIFLLFILINLVCNEVFASCGAGNDTCLQITVTEKIPGGNCEEDGVLSDGSPKYICYVERGFGSLKSVIGELIKYFTYITGLAGVLYIVINGLLLSFSGIDPGKKDYAKKNIQKVVFGLILLLLSGVILKFIAPWVYV